MLPLLFVEAVDLKGENNRNFYGKSVISREVLRGLLTTLSLCLTKFAGVVVLLIFKLSAAALDSLLSSLAVLKGFVTLILSQSLFNLLAAGAVAVIGAGGTDVDVTVVVAVDGGGDGVVVATAAAAGVAVATVLETVTLFVAFAIELIRVETGAGAEVAVAAMLVLIEEIFI